MEKRKILANWIMAPDGTMIPSMHRHDYRTHTSVDETRTFHPDGVEEPNIADREAWSKWHSELVTEITESRFSMADGGSSYLKRGGTFTEMTIYEDDDFEVIRRFLCRGGRGEDGKQPLTWVPLFRMDTEWLKACVNYNNEHGIEGHNKWYVMELNYRRKKGIK